MFDYSFVVAVWMCHTSIGVGRHTVKVVMLLIHTPSRITCGKKIKLNICQTSYSKLKKL